MIQLVAKIVAGLGFVLILTFAILLIDEMGTEERRAAVDAQLDAMAEDPDGEGGLIRSAAFFFQRMKDSVFYTAPITLDDGLPPPPEGWRRVAYSTALGEAIMGEPFDPDPPSTLTRGISKTQEIYRDFSRRTATRNMGAAAVYVRGERMVALSLESSLEVFRSVGEDASVMLPPEVSLERPLLARIDGHSVVQAAQYSTDPDGAPVPVAYRRFTFDLGRIVHGEILTNGADADIMAVLSVLDIGFFQAALPQPTQDYAPGEGLRYLAGEVPPEELPEPSVPLQAYRMLNDTGLVHGEREALVRISRGAETREMLDRQLGAGTYPETERIVSLIGPVPEEGTN